MDPTEIPQLFPRLEQEYYAITSPATSRYNCVAWAAGDTMLWWEPVPMLAWCYWPRRVARDYSLQSYIQVFALQGYEKCEGPDLEPGFEKVALYVDANLEPTHAARQLPSGRWTSKLGRDQDIEHISLSALEGDLYGTVAIILRRPHP